MLDVRSAMARLGVDLSISPQMTNAIERLRALRVGQPPANATPAASPEVLPVRSDTTALIEAVVQDSSGGLISATEVLKQLKAQGWTTESARPGNLITSALGRLADDPGSSVTRVSRGKYRWAHPVSDAGQRADSSSTDAEDGETSVNPTSDEGRNPDGTTEEGLSAL